MNVNDPNEACSCERYTFFHVKEIGCPGTVHPQIDEERIKRFIEQITGWVEDARVHASIERLLRYQYEEVRRNALDLSPQLLDPRSIPFKRVL